MPVDYSKFDRLVAASEEEDQLREEAHRKAEEERLRKDREERRLKELKHLRSAEDSWRSRASAQKDVTKDAAAASTGKACGANGLDTGPTVLQQAMRSKAASKNFEDMTQAELENVEVDEFFRPLTEEEKREKLRLKEERQESEIRRLEAAGKQPLRDTGMTPEQTAARIEHLEADLKEMVKLMERSDRPVVKARLGEFVVELGNDLARLRADPLELDDEDRHELRLFQLRRLQFPGSARTRQEFAVDESACAPKALTSQELDLRCSTGSWEEPWQPITSFGLELGAPETPHVTVDVRVEAVERLPQESIQCSFSSDSFDLQIRHDLEGVKYRLVKTCLQRDIVPTESSFSVRRNHVIVKLAKAPEIVDAREGSIVYLPWTDLCAADRHSRNLMSHRKEELGTVQSHGEY